jgi:MFS family permease
MRYFARNKILRALLIVTGMTLFGSSAINALGIFFLTANLHAARELYGVLGAATGFGVLAGSALAAWSVPKIGAARAFWLGTLITGMLIMIYARLTDFPFALALLFVIGLPSALLNVAIGPLLLQATPRELIGRVVAIFSPATAAAALISTALAGALASTLLRDLHARIAGVNFTTYDTVYLAGGVLITMSSVYAWRQLRGAVTPLANPSSDPAATSTEA